MEAMSGLTGSDALAVMNARDNSGFGYDGGWFWIIIILFAFWGNGFGNRNGNLETDIDTRFLERDIFNTDQNVSTTGCQTQRDVLESKYDLGTQVLENRFNCSQNACNTQKEILQNRYDNALQTQTLSAQMAQCCCDLRAENLANTQKIVDLIQQDKIDQLREQVNTSNLALFGQQLVNQILPRSVPAYPSCSPYVPANYGYGCGNGCGCGNTTVI